MKRCALCGISTSTFKVTLQGICAAVLIQYLSSVAGFFSLRHFETDELNCGLQNAA